MKKFTSRLESIGCWRIFLVGIFFLLLIAKGEAIFLPDNFISDYSSTDNGSSVLPPLVTNSEPSLPFWGLEPVLEPPQLILPEEIQSQVDTINNPALPLNTKIDALSGLNETLKIPELDLPFRQYIISFFSQIAEDPGRFVEDEVQAQLFGNLAQGFLSEALPDLNLAGAEGNNEESNNESSSPTVVGLGVSQDEAEESKDESAPLLVSAQSSSVSDSSSDASDSSSNKVFSSLDKQSSGSLKSRVDGLLNSTDSTKEKPLLISNRNKAKGYLKLSGVTAKVSALSLNPGQGIESKLLLSQLLEISRNGKMPPQALLDYALAKDISSQSRKLAMLLFPAKIKAGGLNNDIRKNLTALRQLLNFDEENIPLEELAVIDLGVLAIKNGGNGELRQEIISQLGRKFKEEAKANTGVKNSDLIETIAAVILYLIDTQDDGKLRPQEAIELLRNSLGKLPRLGTFLENRDGEKFISIKELLRHSLSRLTKDLDFKGIDSLIEYVLGIYSEQIRGKILSKNIGL